MGLYLKYFFIVIVVSSCSTARRSIYYKINHGDTLCRLANRFDTSTESILEFNKSIVPEKLIVGDIILIPGNSKLKKRGLLDLAKKDIVDPKFTAPDDTIDRDGKMMWPIKKSVITSGFGKRGRRFHHGIDIAAKKGTSIYAADNGVVIYSDNKIRGYGKMVVIKHSDNISTIYAHNQTNLVKKGQLVKKGEIIGRVGKTGNASGYHLHFEVRRGKVAMNPLKFLDRKEYLTQK